MKKFRSLFGSFWKHSQKDFYKLLKATKTPLRFGFELGVLDYHVFLMISLKVGERLADQKKKKFEIYQMLILLKFFLFRSPPISVSFAQNINLDLFELFFLPITVLLVCNSQVFVTLSCRKLRGYLLNQC